MTRWASASCLTRPQFLRPKKGCPTGGRSVVGIAEDVVPAGRAWLNVSLAAGR
ncbi:hypothetical protein [Kibdelosporangium aridum]|uniref:hypothetical protein n=1 Tax=Kibdelosporangium aridum TaxID=2030 RepID=UPI00135699FC|nr:hypothetical protein [Kibdelosporangium aridum]